MERYIDADALIKRLEELSEDEWNKKVGASIHLCDCADLVDDFPTADVRENVHAVWVHGFDGCDHTYTCSNCGTEALTEYGTMYDEVCSEYCPKLRCDDGKE